MKRLGNAVCFRRYGGFRRGNGLEGATAPAPGNLLLLCAAALAVACGCGGAAQATPKLKVLYSFTNIRGIQPVAGLIADAAGNLYGTTSAGGANNYGVVFALNPAVVGEKAWTETVLHDFDKADGATLEVGLLAHGAGNLFGTTFQGGSGNGGVVFELSPPTGGGTAWTETVLHAFDGTDGSSPDGGLLADGAGNLYGTTFGGGKNGDGVVYKLTP